MSLKSETDEIYDDLKKEKREKNPENDNETMQSGADWPQNTQNNTDSRSQ